MFVGKVDPPLHPRVGVLRDKAKLIPPLTKWRIEISIKALPSEAHASFRGLQNLLDAGATPVL